MRQIILDTETTGLDPRQGHRVIEVAGVELVDRRPTGRQVHFRLNPERDIDAAATEVHGLTWDDLRDKPRFADISAELLDFLRDAEVIIHNAPFDVAFFDAEFELCGMPQSAGLYARLVDTLALARETFPGKRNNLDALCERFGVSNAHRTLHGALLDAQLLAMAYLELRGGRERKFEFANSGAGSGRVSQVTYLPRQPRPAPLPSRVRPEDEAAHAAFVGALGESAVWKKYN
jgi:DNA polymerase-3 subunit epsilon